MPQLHNEQELIAQMIAGDVFAFRQLYIFYQGRVFLYALSYTKTRHLAEEAVQEVFIRIWERRQAIQADQPFEPYIKVSVRNQVFNMLRQIARDKIRQETVYQNIQHLNSSPNDALAEKELQRIYAMAVKSLSPQQQAAYQLSREEELTYEQIAEKLGISKATVKRHIHEAIHNIRDQVSRNGDLTPIIAVIISCIK